MFTWTAVANGNNYFFSNMYMNDDIIALGWSNSNNGAESGSNTIFIHCDSGSRVYIQCGPDRNCRSRTTEFGLIEIHTFAGFMVSSEGD